MKYIVLNTIPSLTGSPYHITFAYFGSTRDYAKATVLECLIKAAKEIYVKDKQALMLLDLTNPTDAVFAKGVLPCNVVKYTVDMRFIELRRVFLTLLATKFNDAKLLKENRISADEYDYNPHITYEGSSRPVDDNFDIVGFSDNNGNSILTTLELSLSLDT